MKVYYNEIDPAAAHVLECLVKDGVIADGVVDRRSIADVDPKDVAGFRQAHFFAGGGLWSVAARMAGWRDDRALWTGSCPCQPFSVAGKGAGENDPRHLWPDFFRLIAACRPAVVVGEQVAGASGYRWFDGVAADLEGEDYACRAVDIPACAVDAPHIRQRLYWVVLDDAVLGRHRSSSEQIRSGFHGSDNVADANSRGCAGRSQEPQWSALGRTASEWSGSEWLTGADGKARRAQPGVRLLVDGFPNRVAALRIAGNAIVAPLAAKVLEALMESLP